MDRTDEGKTATGTGTGSDAAAGTGDDTATGSDTGTATGSDTGTRVAVAGTFGPLHDGHRRLLGTALKYGDGGVVVGLATDAFARGKRTRPVPDFENRKTAVESALADLDRWNREVEVRPLDSTHGIVVEDPSIDALVVSPETADELTAINDQRREAGYDPLEGIVAPYVLADDGHRISSTRIVHGEIDEHGTVLE